MKMNEDLASPAGASGPRRSKWPERLWAVAALVLVMAAGIIFAVQRIDRWVQSAGISHEIDPELEPVASIDIEPGALKGYNVLIITSDTTRADHIGCYGNRSVETPVIDGLARDGVLFSEAVTPSPNTMPAHSSLLTGLYPFRHGVRANGTFRLDPKVSTLAEQLKKQGYRTGAVISAFVLDSRFGLDQGFDLYHDDLTKGMQYSPHMFRERAAELTNEPAAEWLQQIGDEPFFLWVHYFDPHSVYMPPEPFRTRYAYDLYDGEIAYVDSQIGALLDQLDALGVRDRTLIVYTSDHGEGLGEHGEFSHSLLIYDATMHVPLIIHAPKALPRGKVIGQQCCLVDVVPTVLSLLGEPVPQDLDGVNLCAPPATENRPVLIETIATMTLHGWAPLVGVRRTDYKYILAPTPEIYDLRSDQRELANIHDDSPDVVRTLSAALAQWLGQDPFLAARKALDLENLQTDEESLRHLAALGYVSTTRTDEAENPARELPDPKIMIGHWETVQHAIHVDARGDPQQAVALLEPQVAEVPGDVFSRIVLGGIYRRLGEDDRALAHFQRAEEDEPNDPAIRIAIGDVYFTQRKYKEAEQKIREALAIDPSHGQAHIALAQLALARGKQDEAIGLYRKAIELDPGATGADAHNKIGFLYLYQGRLDDARREFRSAIEIDSLNGVAHDGLANILVLEGRTEDAMTELQAALRFDPNQPRALASLASLLSQQGDQEKALALCTQAIKIAPKNSIVHNNLGLVHRRRGDTKLAEEHYLKAIEFGERIDAAHVNLAQLYAMQGKKEEALEHFRLAVDANPYYPNPIALANLGAYHFNKGDVDKALAFYRRALAVHPDYALVHKNLASIYALAEYDRPDLTAFHLRRSLELEPNQDDAQELRELLENAEAEMARRGSSPPGPEPQTLPDSDIGDPAAASRATGDRENSAKATPP
jgi:arylsulfatase A-like enzyme/tetratricopeptide (TPR) repeat protein